MGRVNRGVRNIGSESAAGQHEETSWSAYSQQPLHERKAKMHAK
jgi:hypothetical protein